MRGDKYLCFYLLYIQKDTLSRYLWLGGVKWVGNKKERISESQQEKDKQLMKKWLKYNNQLIREGI